MKYGTVSQLILYVNDIGKQLEFYGDILGLQVSYPIHDTQEAYNKETWITFDTGTCVLALHAGGKGMFGKDAPKFNIEVNDLENLREKLQKINVKCADIFSPIPGKRIMLITDPEGIMFYAVDHN